MAEKSPVTEQVVADRIRIAYEETYFMSVPTDVDLDELTRDIYDAYEPPFSTPEDFALDFETREQVRLLATVGELDEFIERWLGLECVA